MGCFVIVARLKGRYGTCFYPGTMAAHGALGGLLTFCGLLRMIISQLSQIYAQITRYFRFGDRSTVKNSYKVD
jgi:hypothetical protein